MTEEERRIISAFVERMAGVAAPQAGAARSPWGGSVPAVQSRPALPPVDPEADAMIGELFARYPEARYRLTQTAFVQEHALVQAQNRIQDLEWQLENAQRQGQAAQQQGRGGLFGGMFGGGNNNRQVPMTPQPQPLQPPMGYSPGMMQGRGGSGFLGSALTTAAGVAGGMMLGNAMMGMFSGGAAEAATGAVSDAAGAVGDFAQEAVPTSASPWTDPGQDAGQDATPVADDGGWGNDASSDGGYTDDAGGGGYEDDI
jgi:hypothetical protein